MRILIALGLVLMGLILLVRPSRGASVNMKAIRMIESFNNPLATNPRSGAIGLYQITRVVRDEYNHFHPEDRIEEKDLFDAKKNSKVAHWYMNTRIPNFFKHYGIKDTVENRIVAWNAGCSYLMDSFPPIPKETRNFIKRYRRMINV